MDETPSVEKYQVTPSPAPESAWLGTAEVLALVGGVLAVLVGLAAGAIYLLFALLPPTLIGPRSLSSVVVGFSVLVLGVALGGGLVFQAIKALLAQPSSRLILPSPLLLLLAFVVVLGLGVVTPSVIRDARLIFPVFYFLGILLPILTVLSAVQRRLARQGLNSAWREATLQLSSGAFLSTGSAMILEAGAVVLLIASIAILIAVSPAVGARFREWLPALRNPNWVSRPADLEELLSSPVVLGLAFFILAVAAPLIEEAVKALGVVLMIYRRPSVQQAVWWGLLGGAGFTLTEGLLNGSLSLGQMSWSTLALVRVGTALMHCTTGALMGLGWRSLLLEQRVGSWLKRYTQAVALHAIWNSLTLGLLLAPTIGDESAARVAAMLFLALLLLLEVAGLGVLLRRLTDPRLA
jgi:RsiW-degrading membrane proteinase PrsW (M82 family)